MYLFSAASCCVARHKALELPHAKYMKNTFTKPATTRANSHPFCPSFGPQCTRSPLGESFTEELFDEEGLVTPIATSHEVASRGKSAEGTDDFEFDFSIDSDPQTQSKQQSNPEADTESKIKSDAEHDFPEDEAFTDHGTNSAESNLDFPYDSDAQFRYRVFTSIPHPKDLANRTRDSDTSKRLQETYARLNVLGSDRLFAKPSTIWQLELRMLRDKFPNFADVLDQVVAPHLALIATLGKHHTMRPMLLWGEPGIGKSAFCNALKRLLNTRMHYLDASTLDTPSALTGSSTVWSNSTAGCIFELLAFDSAVDRAYANPIIFLDEVCKVPSYRSYPLSPLYQALEISTARCWSDLAVPNVVLDASKITWILCANSIDEIPAPLLSRLLVYKIELPDAMQQRSVITGIFAELAVDLDPQMSPDLDDRIVVDAVDLSPRAAKVRLELACSMALASGRYELDYQTWASTAKRKGNGRASKFGFV